MPTSICLIYIILLFDYYLTKNEAEGDHSLYIKRKKKKICWTPLKGQTLRFHSEKETDVVAVLEDTYFSASRAGVDVYSDTEA